MQSNLTRRTLLTGAGALGLAGALSACGGGSSDSDSDGAQGSSGGLGATGPAAVVPLQVDATVAATGVPGAVPMFAYITGSVIRPGGPPDFYRYDPAQGKPVPMALADNTMKGAQGNPDVYAATGLSGALYQQNYPLDWANYSIPLSRDQPTVIADLVRFKGIPGIGTGASALSARVWISIGKPLLPFTPQADASGRVTGYAGADFFDGASGALCFFDFMEFSYDSTGALNINPSLVDQFGFPLTVWTTDANGRDTEPQGRFTVPRAAMLAAIAGLDVDFNTPIRLPESADIAAGAYPLAIMQGRVLRQISPSKASKNTASTYLQSAVAQAYSGWTRNAPVAVTNSGNTTGRPNLQPTYYGYASGNTLAFFPSADLAGAPVFSFDDLSTGNIYSCAGSADGSKIPAGMPGDLVVNLRNTGKALLAAFNRGVVDGNTRHIDITPNRLAPPSGSYYKLAHVRYNAWAEYLHGVSANGRAYAFGYDDVGDQNPSIDTPGANGLFIQMGQFA